MHTCQFCWTSRVLIIYRLLKLSYEWITCPIIIHIKENETTKYTDQNTMKFNVELKIGWSPQGGDQGE